MSDRKEETARESKENKEEQKAPAIPLSASPSQSMIHKISDRFTTERLMMMLDKDKLEALEDEFNEHPEGLEQRNFVWLMKCAMAAKPEDKYDMVHGLCKLFAEIDINGDMKMQWSEFAQYVIDAVMQNPVKKNSKGEIPNQKDLLEQAHSQKFTRFGESQNMDRFVHEGLIQNVIYYQSLDKLLLVETRSHLLKLLSPDLKKREVIDLWNKDVDLYNSKSEAIADENRKRASLPQDNYFVLATSYNEKENLLVCVCSNKTIQVFGLYGHTFKRVKIKEIAEVQYGIWYLERHKAWITASKEPEKQFTGGRYNSKHSSSGGDDKMKKKNYLNDWNINPLGPVIEIYQSFVAHEGQIMDVVELRNPAAIATCSLDKCIHIWDLSNGVKLGSLEENGYPFLEPKHMSGVRSLDYTPEFSGYIISVGHENYIKVWSPEVSIYQAYVGSLEGHNTAVMSAKFIQKSPYVISIDEKLNIRVWDVRTMSCLQVLSQDRKKFDCNGVTVIGSQRKFVIYGRRLILFDTISDKGSMKMVKPIEEVYPIKVEFNAYYKTFAIVTKIDVRIYDGRSGQLIKVFSELMPPGLRNVELTAFCLDDRNRKFYIGDTLGNVRVYNVSNGVFIRAIGEDDGKNGEIIGDDENGKSEKEAKEEEEKREAKKGQKKDYASEITDLKFINAHKILMTAIRESMVRFWDEEDPEITPELRRLYGLHPGSEITRVEFSDHLSLIATGASNGAIFIWDFEMSRYEGCCLQHTREILSLRFLDPYPVLLSASADGYICLWGVRGCDLHYRSNCIATMINLYPVDLGYNSLNLTDMIVFSGEQDPIMPDYDQACYVPDEEANWKKKYLACMKEVAAEWSAKGGTDRFVDSKVLQIDTSKNACKVYLISGDEKGKVRIWDIAKVLAHFKISPVVSFRDKKPYFNAKRKEKLKLTSQFSKMSGSGSGSISNVIIAEQSLIVKQWEAHKDFITHVSKIYKPEGYATASMDKHVKLWARDGKPWGDIVIVGENPVKNWMFPFDWGEVREIEKNEVIEVMKVIEPSNDIVPQQIVFENSEENEVKIVKKREVTGEIIPKRSINNKDQSTTEQVRKQREVVAPSKERNAEEEEKFIKKIRKEEDHPSKPDPRFAQDIDEMLNQFRDGDPNKKRDIKANVEKMESTFKGELKEAFHLPEIKPDNSGTLPGNFSNTMSAWMGKKKDAFPLHFAREKRAEDAKDIHAKYAISVGSGAHAKGAHTKLGKRKEKKGSVRHSLQLSKKSHLGGVPDKLGKLTYLTRMDVVASALTSNKSAGDLMGRTATASKMNSPELIKDMRYMPGEATRLIGQTISALKMKKLSDIRNYNPADNVVLQKQLKMINAFESKSYTHLPKFKAKKL